MDIYQLVGESWILTSTLRGDLGTFFGYTISCSPSMCLVGVPISGKLIIGAPCASSLEYIYVGVVDCYTLVDNNWVLSSTLSKTEPENDFFGASVSISGNYALVGSFFYPSISIFELIDNEWVIQNTIRSESLDVALSGNWVFVVSANSATSVDTYLLTDTVGPTPTRRPSIVPSAWSFQFDVVQVVTYFELNSYFFVIHFLP